jgi:hypothetical protein
MPAFILSSVTAISAPVGQGAALYAQIDAARKFVDPDHKLPESERNLAALGSVWQYYVAQGNVQKAQNAAVAMLEYYQHVVAQYAGLAKQAADGGDMDGAAQAAMKAYANVPAGRNTKMRPTADGKGIEFVFTGANGKITYQRIPTPQQLGAAAMGIGNGDFDKRIIEATGTANQRFPSPTIERDPQLPAQAPFIMMTPAGPLNCIPGPSSKGVVVADCN